MTDAAPRRRGGQVGNQNARKSGFYSHCRTFQACQPITSSQAEDKIKQDIATVRVTIASTLTSDPDNARLLLLSNFALQNMLRTKRLIQRRRREKARRDAARFARLVSITQKTSHARNATFSFGCVCSYWPSFPSGFCSCLYLGFAAPLLPRHLPSASGMSKIAYR